MQWQPGQKLAEVELDVIKQALNYFNGNKTKAAQCLDISIRTIDNRLKGTEIGNGKEEKAETPKKPYFDTSSGLHVESDVKAPKKQTVPMRQRDKVQEMSSK